jgi:predicted phage terminase large subunit-like protein
MAQVMETWDATPATLAYELSHHQWVPARHLCYISAVAANKIYRALELGEDSFTVFTAPPRHGKTDLVSKYTPVWTLNHWPWARIILTSYGGDLAQSSARHARNIAVEGSDRLKFRLRYGSTAVDDWATTVGGGLLAAGIGGPIVGRGGHVIIVDDIHKSFEEAHSPTARRKVIDWFQGTLFSRREPGCAMLIFAQRQHKDDLIGWLKTEYDLRHLFTFIDLPAIAHQDDPMGRLPGQALWPERFDTDALAITRVGTGPYVWAAQYDQAPRPESEQQQDPAWFRFIDIPPNLELLQLVRYWDFAASEPTAAHPEPDYTVGILMGKDKEGRLYILDLIRMRATPARVQKHVLACAETDPEQTVIRIEEEPGSAGKTVTANYKQLLIGYNFKGIKASGNAIVRMQPFFTTVEQGRVFIKRAKWNKDFLKEFEDFPGDFDDQMNAAAGAHDELTGAKAKGGAFGRTNRASGDTSNSGHGRPGTVKPGRVYGKEHLPSKGATFGRRTGTGTGTSNRTPSPATIAAADMTPTGYGIPSEPPILKKYWS